MSTKEEAKGYVDALIAAGMDVQAMGWKGYMVIDPVDIHGEEPCVMIDWVGEQYENRHSPQAEIIDYLHELGRVRR
jgi:hypothetical protein